MAISLQELLVGLKLDTSDYDAAIGNASTKAQKFAADLAKAGGAISVKDFKSGLEQGLETELRGVAGGLNTVTAAGAGTSTAFNRIQRSAFLLAGQAGGLGGQVGLLANGLLLLTEGSAVVAGVGAGLVGIIATIKLFSDPIIKAREEVDKLVASLQGAQLGRAPQFVQLTDQFLEANQALQETQDRITTLQRIAGAVNFLRFLNPGAAEAFGKELDADKDRANKLIGDINNLKVVIDQLKPVQSIVPDAAAAAFNLLIANNRAFGADLLRTNQDLAKLNALVNDSTKPVVTRAAALTAELAILGAQKAAIDEQVARFQLIRDLHVDDARQYGLLVTLQERLTASVNAQGGPTRANIQTLQSLAAITNALDKELRQVGNTLTDLVPGFEKLGPAAANLDGTVNTVANLRDVLGLVVKSADEAVARFQALSEVVQATAAPTHTGEGFAVGDSLKKSAQDALKAFQATDFAVGDLEQRLASVNAFITIQGGPHRANIALLQAQLAIVKQINEALKLPNVPTFENQFVSQVEKAAQKSIDANRALQAATQIGLPTGPFKANAEAAQQALDDVERSAVALIATLNLTPEQSVRFFDALKAALTGTKNEFKNVDDSAKALQKTLRDIRAVTAGIREIGDALGGLSDGAAKALKGVESLAEGIAKLPKDPIGGIAGIVGGALGVLSSIFGGNTAHDDAVRQNTQALKDAAAAFRAGTNNPSLLQNASTAALSLQGLSALKGFQSFFGVNQTLAALDAQLKAFGLTFDQLNQIAKANGITLLDSNGRIVAEAFKQLADRLQITVADLATFGPSLDAQRQKLELQAKLFGATGDLTNLGIDKQLLSQALGGSVAQALAGIDVNTSAGQVALKKFLQDLFTKISEGFFVTNPDQLKTTADQLAKIMGTTADDLLNLGNAATGAIAGLTNVPTGFKLALATFNATLDTTADAIAKRALTGGPGFAPTGDPTGGNRGGLLAANVRTAPAIGTQNVVVQIVQQPGESGEVLAERVVQKLRIVARSQTGDTLDFGRLV